MLGRLLDTFVAAPLRCELAASSNGPRLYDLREELGRREVDQLERPLLERETGLAASRPARETCG